MRGYLRCVMAVLPMTVENGEERSSVDSIVHGSFCGR